MKMNLVSTEMLFPSDENEITEDLNEIPQIPKVVQLSNIKGINFLSNLSLSN